MQAEKSAGGSLGRRGSSTHHRSLLQGSTMGMMLASQAAGAGGQQDSQAPPGPPTRDATNERGQGKARQLHRILLNPYLKMCY